MASLFTAPPLRTETRPRSAVPTPPHVPARPGFIKRHPVLIYYVAAFAISWGGMLLVIFGGRSSVPATVEQRHRCF